MPNFLAGNKKLIERVQNKTKARKSKQRLRTCVHTF